MTATLYYAHDPMCSWCWGFAPAWDQLSQQLEKHLAKQLSVETLLGGLAPDSDQPMPESMQQHLQQTWATIQQLIPGTRFNFDFWTTCQPRRSTWPACRGIIAARNQGQIFDGQMSRAISRAYYLDARNPSDDQTLIEIAADLGLDADQFAIDLNTAETRQQHQQEMEKVQELGVQGFPSLVLVTGQRGYPIQIDFAGSASMFERIEKFLPASV